MAFTGISTIDVLAGQLVDGLKRALPGESAQQLMAPSVRSDPGILFDPASARPSGVMILLFPDSRGFINTVFIERSRDGGPHSGQISLPGGRREPGDRDLLETALRESEEEIGVRRSLVTSLGSLTPLYVPNSGNLIHPFIGWLSVEPDLVPDPHEVASIVMVPIESLYDPQNRKVARMERKGLMIEAPYYNAAGHVLWGATAMIMSEFEVLLTSCICG